MHNIITISRQFGSGGHEIGKKLAEKLDVPFYNKTIAESAATNIGIDLNKLPGIDEKAASSFMYSLAMGNNIFSNINSQTLTVQDRLFVEQARLITEYAQKCACIIVGRCADFVLRDNPNVIKIFVCADFEHRT
ncbi:MAG: cytidylate kinase-like family protein, partial [Oscillospiraceae bacterium]|nr:cytidylate kinase-like family protein [Oscillospiraceae bacterium]